MAMACPSLTSSFPQHSPPHTIDASSSFPCTSSTEHPDKKPFDVFINHRGPDVKKTFASPLYYFLRFCGLRVFLDKEELREGEKLTSQIEAAIATAAVHVAILSPAYAESKWCLDELVSMVNSGKPIIPVFYGVKPAELRWTRSKDEIFANVLRTLGCWPRGIDGMFSKILRIFGWWKRGKAGVYEQALFNLEKKKTFDPTTNEEKSRYEPGTIEDWRNALSSIADISGFELEACKGDNGELLNKIVQRVQKWVRKPPLHVAKYPTGLEEKVAKVEDLEKRALLENQSGKAQVVGIVGSGGIGKTTLAIKFFNQRRTYYEASSFLHGVREAAANNSLHGLQAQLFRDLTQIHDGHQIGSINQGIEMLRRFLSPSEALVILDDVDHRKQLDALLLPLKDALRPSSLILVTSRNKEVLTGSGIVESSIYQLTGLSRQHSQELFCRHAFNQPRPLVGFEEMVAKFLDACDGLPLSLEVIGALLHGKKDLEYWETQLRKISKALPSDIQSSLKISYDSLDDEEKEIFLDIACFFVGEDKDTVIRISQGSGWEGALGIRNLENKCLVEVDRENRIRMHDHLRDLGRYLAEKEPPPPRHLLRLWRPIENLTPQNVRPQSPVRGIRMVQQPRQGNPLELQNRSDVDMSSLQLLKAEGDCLESIFTGLPYSPDLVCLYWDNCPHSVLPSWLPIKKLRVLQITGGQALQTFWQSESEAPLQLRELIVNVPVSQFPKSMWQLQHLEKIELTDQVNMIFLPDSFGNLTNLRYLDLSGSSSLQELPHSFGNLIRLEHLCLARCSKLQELPHSIGNFIRLQHLCLARCSALSICQGTLGNITTLISLDLSFCLKMKVLPPQVASQRSLEELNLLGTSLKELPKDHIGELGRLKTLKLGSPFLKELPPSLGDLTTLKEFNPSVCRSLECLPNSVEQLIKMEILNSDTGTEISTDTVINKCMVGLEYLQLYETSVSELFFVEGICPNIQHLEIHYCNVLVEIGALPTSLITLQMRSCGALSQIGGLCGLAKLQQLDISGCQQVVELPSLETLTSLEELRACECKQLKNIRGLAQLVKLRLLHVKECPEIEELEGIEYLRSLKEIHYSGCPKLQACREVLEQTRVRVPERKVPDAKSLSGDEKLHAYDYTIENYLGNNTNDSYFDVSELLKAIDSISGISDWLKVM